MKKCPNCGNKYRDTDYYCLKDNYRLIKCNDNELSDVEKLEDKINNDRYKYPNKYGNFEVNPTNNIPHCPICNSVNLHKISKTNKVGSATFFGLFSLGHISKTFECDSCGYKF